MTDTPSRPAAASPGGGASTASTARSDRGAPSPARAPLKRRRMSRRARRDALVFLAFAAPNLVLIAMFTYRPLFMNIRSEERRVGNECRSERAEEQAKRR